MDYKDTLNLPKTTFPMKANLPKLEPRDARAVGGDGHLRADPEGGRRPPAVDPPRWPALRQRAHPHGHGAEQDPEGPRGQDAQHARLQRGVRAGLGLPRAAHRAPGGQGARGSTPPGVDVRQAMDPVEKIRRCREYALRFIDIQREEFKRLGVFGDWDEPLRHARPEYEAVIVREFGRFVGQGAVYKGLKPVHWCMHCKTALAQAEVEYEDETTPSVYVKFPVVSRQPGARGGARRPQGLARRSGPPRPGPCPPTSPSPCIPTETYTALEVDGRVARRGAPARGRGRQSARRGRARARDEPRPCPAPPSRARVARHPWIDARRRRARRGLRGDGRRHRARAHRPRPRRGGLRAGAPRRAQASTTRWTTTGASSPRSSTSRGRRCGRRTPGSSRCSASAARCSPRCR